MAKYERIEYLRENPTKQIAFWVRPFYKLRVSAVEEIHRSIFKFQIIREGELLHKVSPTLWSIIPIISLLIGAYVGISGNVVEGVKMIPVILFFAVALIGILDPFSGIATTGVACNELNRNYIGYELNEEYAEFSRKRLNGETEQYKIVQYTLDGERVAEYVRDSKFSRILVSMGTIRMPEVIERIEVYLSNRGSHRGSRQSRAARGSGALVGPDAERRKVGLDVTGIEFTVAALLHPPDLFGIAPHPPGERFNGEIP